MKLYREDIKAIGHTAYEVEGCLAIVVDPDKAAIEKILLREILALDGYGIVAEEDWPWSVEGSDIVEYDIRWLTSMPWEDYVGDQQQKGGSHEWN